MSMRFFKYTIVLNPEKEKGEVYYNVSVPALPEIATFGDSIEEARYMAQDALELVVLSRLERDEALPEDAKPKKLSKNAKVEEIVVTVAHQVNASPADYVKNAVFQGSRSS